MHKVLKRKEQLWSKTRLTHLLLVLLGSSGLGWWPRVLPTDQKWGQPLYNHIQNTFVSHIRNSSLAYYSCQSPLENKSIDEKDPAILLKATMWTWTTHSQAEHIRSRVHCGAALRCDMCIHSFAEPSAFPSFILRSLYKASSLASLKFPLGRQLRWKHC